ncbi:MAG: MAPEG family protein [Proteobacteria bacterium]|nr:MAPEG family protein [Pseudomonadota bacterium]
MTVALWCLFVACLLPVVCAGVAKSGFENFDNRRPRDWLAKQQGWRARAHAAQQNSWEALLVFAAGVLSAHLAQAPQDWVNLVALVFVAARLLYIALYVTDRSTARSLVWAVGFLASLSLFWLAL